MVIRETRAGVTVRAPQTKLQIKHERIRRHAVGAPLEIAAPVFRVTPARTAHDNHLMRSKITKPQPPIALLLLQLHEDKI